MTPIRDAGAKPSWPTNWPTRSPVPTAPRGGRTAHLRQPLRLFRPAEFSSRTVIEKAEIEAKSDELGVHTSNVQRDYVFGWIIAGLYQQDNPLSRQVILKG